MPGEGRKPAGEQKASRLREILLSRWELCPSAAATGARRGSTASRRWDFCASTLPQLPRQAQGHPAAGNAPTELPAAHDPAGAGPGLGKRDLKQDGARVSQEVTSPLPPPLFKESDTGGDWGTRGRRRMKSLISIPATQEVLQVPVSEQQLPPRQLCPGATEGFATSHRALSSGQRLLVLQQNTHLLPCEDRSKGSCRAAGPFPSTGACSAPAFPRGGHGGVAAHGWEPHRHRQDRVHLHPGMVVRGQG